MNFEMCFRGIVTDYCCACYVLTVYDENWDFGLLNVVGIFDENRVYMMRSMLLWV